MSVAVPPQGEFLVQYFPRPDAVTAGGKRKRGVAGPADDATGYLSLNDFLEDLMNAATSRALDPYIVLTAAHWPPYVELILRAGIGILHPKDHTRMRLQDFHV